MDRRPDGSESPAVGGWFTDPDGQGGERWWDGVRWTSQVRRRGRSRVAIGIAVAGAVAAVGLAVFGMLAMMGFFDKPSLARVVSIESDRICVRSEGRQRIRCIPNPDELELVPGDCVLVFYGEGVRLDRWTECPAG